MIHAESVSVRYGSKRALDDVTLDLAPGSVCALLGRNGAGKSSLVRCIVGQQRPDAGRVTLFGEDVWTNRTKLMDRTGIVPEEADAPPDMTVAQIAAFCARVYSRWSDAVLTFLRDTAEPYLRLFRRFIPLLGGVDLSPMVGIIVLYFLRAIVVNAIHG